LRPEDLHHHDVQDFGFEMSRYDNPFFFSLNFQLLTFNHSEN